MKLFIESPLERKLHPYQKKITLRAGIQDFLPYEVTMPEPPLLKEFINSELPVEEQFFKREVIPEWVWTLTKAASVKGKREEVIAKIERSKEYSDFIAGQWDKRRNGVFMYVYGIPLWIPGSYWWFLNYCNIEGALPEFRFVDLEYWYWWELCVKGDPNVYGGIEMTQRRDGKSVRAGANVLEATSRNAHYHAGVQSKTYPDAKDLFSEKIILAWHGLPIYFSPKFDSKLYPSSEINFRDPKLKEEDVVQFESAELNSWIQARPSVYTAFDGAKLHFYLLDEAGKIEEMLVTQTWRVAKQCLRVRGEIIGKALITSTVEETTKGGLKEFKKIWDASNREKTKLNKLGQTESGLIPYYKPAQETFVFDQYGFSIIGEPLLHQKRWRFEHGDKDWEKGGQELVDIEINSQKDAIERQKTIRMYSRNLREAFRTDVKHCHFNLGKIDARLDDFSYGNDLVVVGNLVWKDGVVDSTVEFREQANGRWQFKKTVLDWLIANSNNVKNMGGELFPGNRALGVIDCDPYKYDNVQDEKRRSLGVAFAYLTHIPDIDRGEDENHWETDDLIGQYSFRGTVSAFNEDIILFIVFMGMMVNAETNSGNVNEHLISRGYHRFLKFRKKVKKKEGRVQIEESTNPGFITLGDSSKKPLFDATDTYIEYKCHRCVFPDFLQDCKDVEYDNLNPYDYFVAGSNCIYDATTGNIRMKKPEVNKTASAGLWQPR